MANPNVEPLAQEYIVASRVPDPEVYFFHDPNMTRLDDGSLLIAAPLWGRNRPEIERSTWMMRSADEGETWEELSPLPYAEATPFLLGGQLLMFVQHSSHRDFNIVSSDDGGRTWTQPQRVLEGPFWNISTAMVVRPEALYWAMDYDGEEEMNERSRNGMVMVKHDRSRSPMDPESWSYSNVVPRPELPDSLNGGHFPPGRSPQISRDPSCVFGWVEPNTVEVNGRIRVFNRCTIDDYSSTGIAGALEYDPEEDRLEFKQFVSWPGGQCKFYVIHDQPNAMYWLFANLATNSHDLLGWGSRMRESGFMGGPGNERRWLYLYYSIDCLSWFPAGCVARWPANIRRSFMYPSPVVVSDDIIMLSRTSHNAGNQHDADLCTIHRIRNFRSLAMDLHQGGLHRD